MTTNTPNPKMRPQYGGLWTREIDEFLYASYGTLTAEHLATRINTEFDTKFTAKAVLARAQQDLALDGRDCQGFLTVTEAARQLKTDPSGLLKFINKHKLPLQGKGKYRYLTDDTWRVVQSCYTPPPEPCIGPAEAATRLNYTLQNIHKMFKRRGMIRAYRVGNFWQLSLADVERLEREQKGRYI